MVAVSADPVTSPIDWSVAVRTGRRLAPIGPPVTPQDAARLVADLRTFSARAELAVRDTTDLGHGLPVEDAEVVDRGGWIEATAQGMAVLAAPLTDKLGAAIDGPARGFARGVTGSQVGVLLGFLSGRVLGQYDPVGDPGGAGRLLLVAPNIAKVEREIGADPTDFRLWVCLHESTHRLQFTAVPWLRDYFRSLVTRFAEHSDADPAAVIGRAVTALRSGALRGGQSWIEGIQSPEQRAVFDQLMAFMTLLEGHADYVMDAVGPAVVASVASIRASVTVRRKRVRGPIDRLLRALLGMDMKLAQYIKGGAFVGSVVKRVGMHGFNQVWTSPETLPTRQEISEPIAWVARVLG